jgi:DNA-binding response OmpR family regulator
MENYPNILIVDDEEDILDLIAYHLEKEEMRILKAKDGEHALNILWDEQVDLVILDLMLPGINGLEVLKTLRSDARTENLPVILLTAKTTEIDRIVGFELGTDDYICKPFSIKELVARVKALLKRAAGFLKDNVFSGHDIVINFQSHKITAAGKPVELTPREFAILAYLYRRRETVISRAQLLDKIWGMDSSVDDRAVDVNITRLREKLGRAKRLIKTVKGYGYMFDTGASEE